MAIYCCIFVILFYIIVVYLYFANLCAVMEEIIIPYELPEVENHSFFFIDQRVETQLKPNCINTMHGSYIMYYMDMELGWQVIRYNLFRQVM